MHTYRKIFFGNSATEELARKKIQFWRKKNNIGIVAKMASNPDHARKLKLTFVSRISDEIKKKIFIEILISKYKLNEDLRDILMATGNKTLVEFSRGAERL